LEIVSSRARFVGRLCPAYDLLGFDRAAGGDEVFRNLLAGQDHRADQQAGLVADAV
jgi:hypothetical protein